MASWSGILHIILLTTLIGFPQEEEKEEAAASNAVSDAEPGAPEPAFLCEIEASLDQAEWKLEGREKIIFYNRTEDSFDQLVFLLPANAYANPGALRRAGYSESGRYGFIEIGSVTLEDGTPLPAEPEILGDRMPVHLPSPLEPGEEIAMDVTFVTKLPSSGSGPLGYVGRHLDAFDWYPKPGSLIDPGPVPDVGNFIVTLSLPSAFQVEATGTIKENYEKNALRTVVYEAAGVNDFAWTADPFYEVEKSTYKGVNIVVLGQPFMEDKIPALVNTAKDCLDRFSETLTAYPYDRFVVSTGFRGAGSVAGAPMFTRISQGFPTHLSFLRERTLRPERDVIDSMSRQYFHGPLRGEGTEGAWLSDGLAAFLELEMEEEAIDDIQPGPLLDGVENEILCDLLNHGFGFYPSDATVRGVCCGRFRPYLRYINTNALVGFYSSPFHASKESSLLGYRIEDLKRPGWNIRRRALIKSECERAARYYPAGRPEGDHLSGSTRGLITNRVALCLKTLKNAAGDDVMNRILKSYAEKFLWKRPCLDDLLAVVHEEGGAVHASMLEELLRSDGFIDYAVDLALCRPAEPARGYAIQRKAGEHTSEVASEEDREETSSTGLSWGSLVRFGRKEDEELEKSGSKPPSYQWQVIVSNRGDIALPVSVLLSFEGGKQKKIEWNGKDGFLRLSGEGQEKLLSAAVDPEGKYALDLNRVNNTRCVEFNETGVLFLTGCTHFWVQNYLNGWAFLN